MNARQLLRQYYPFLAFGKKGLVSLAIPGLFLAFPREVETLKGKRRKKVYRPVAVVAVLRLTEDNVPEVKELSLSADQEPPATYKGAYLLLSNRFDAPAEVVGAYQKRWRIEIFFRNAKQELGLAHCHSTSENTIHAYFTLLFVAETLIRFAQWEHNKEGEVVTHGEIVRLLFRCRCWVEFCSSPSGRVVHPVMDAAAKRFQRLCEAYWPDRAEMKWFNSNSKWKQLPLSA